MQITREELNPCTLRLSVVCDPEQVKQGFDKAIKQIAKTIKLPGFRPGNAPKALVEGMIAREELFEEAAERVIQATYSKAIEAEGIVADRSVRPIVELTKIDRDNLVVEYTAKVPLPPQVTIGEYRGIPLVRPAIEVSGEEIEQQITEFRKRRQTRDLVSDRGVEDGDATVLNINVEGEEGDGRTFMVVAGQAFDQLDEAIAGMKVEEIKSVELSFPEDFQEQDWAGKTLQSQISVNSISGVQLPALDDAFAQSLNTNNLDELRTRISDAIYGAKENMVREAVLEQLYSKLHETSIVHVSDNMWEALAAQRLRETQEEQEKEGRSLEQYAAENGMTLDALTEAWQSKSKMHVERALLIREIFTREQMQISNEELNRELYAMADEYELPAEEMFKLLKKNDALDELQFRTISSKVARFLEDNAKEVYSSLPVQEAVSEVAVVDAEEVGDTEVATDEATKPE